LYLIFNELKKLIERNFILCFYGAQVYGFVHRTFLEYFCAAEIVYRFEWLDSQEFIDEERVADAADAFELHPETIRQHYEAIAKEISLRLSWVQKI
jgi:predicted NACHT family NTPase